MDPAVAVARSAVKFSQMAGSGKVSDEDLSKWWEQLGEDLELRIDPEYCKGQGELLVEFPTGVRINQGGKMKISDVRNAPTKMKCAALAASGNADDLYLLMMINPDVPSLEKPVQRSWLHWMLCNVKGFQLESGRVLCNYQPPTPSANSGIHRYVIFLFKQQDHLDQVAAYEDARRGKFSVTDFSKRYSLGEPVAMTFFRADRPGSRRK